MSDPRHPTCPSNVMFDPLVAPPPRGQLILATIGGCCVIGPWSDDCIAWAYKPQIPESVKLRTSGGPR